MYVCKSHHHGHTEAMIVRWTCHHVSMLKLYAGLRCMKFWKSIEERKTEARIFFSRKDQKIGSSGGRRSGSRYGDQRLGVDTPFSGDGPHRRPPLLHLQAHALLSSS
ncbi:hypothetical protein Gotri_005736 [Gossypium trilobum]|uniref:Uncharacterized protein n=1 Tax=Gossypium trilobum TaxID=34281 RepID=A0A7J9EXL2_9ROSI|nr:hypothetical protein [Gossypium trilobum]